jgi:hypothetical protein
MAALLVILLTVLRTGAPIMTPDGESWLIVFAVILVLPACFCLAAEEREQLRQMERDIEQPKSDYEARVEVLESRVKELEGQASPTVDEAKELDQIKAETHVTY